MPKGVYERKRSSEIAVKQGPNGLLALRGTRNVRTISAAFIADWEEDWREHGKQVLAIVREKFPERYFEGLVKMAQVLRIEADIKHTFNKPRSVEEALDELEAKVGAQGRRKFERFLAEVEKDKDVVEAEIVETND